MATIAAAMIVADGTVADAVVGTADQVVAAGDVDQVAAVGIAARVVDQAQAFQVADQDVDRVAAHAGSLILFS